MQTMYRANHSKMIVEQIEVFRFTEGSVYFDKRKRVSRKKHTRGAESFSYWETREEAIESIKEGVAYSLEMIEKMLESAKKRHIKAQNLI